MQKSMIDQEKNNGELPMYLVENNHEAIISRGLFNQIQEEMARRANLDRVARIARWHTSGQLSSVAYLLIALESS